MNILIKEFVKTVSANQTKAITFSDSIIVFSKGGTFQDATKIYVDAYAILRIALKNKIPMKGAISYGDITVDFDKPIFFGQPIIDAYLLHEDLLMLSTIIDHNAEKRFKYLNDKYFNESSLVRYNAFMKYGSVSHTLIRPTSSSVKDEIKLLTKLYLDTSGKSRIYIDNTLKFFNSLIKK
ncbi:MAG: hypothetical protein IIC75_06510 [Bacteroidetes bacterium]|nr:hypothetical protein [Bacteroidota bacterium]